MRKNTGKVREFGPSGKMGTMQEPQSSVVLLFVLGCGNSTMSSKMYHDGYRDITNIDYSTVVIKKMREKYKSINTLRWEVMDITDMKFETETFDAIIEKGTLDSLLVTETDPWNLSDTGRQTMDIILSQV